MITKKIKNLNLYKKRNSKIKSYNNLKGDKILSKPKSIIKTNIKPTLKNKMSFFSKGKDIEDTNKNFEMLMQKVKKEKTETNWD